MTLQEAFSFMYYDLLSNRLDVYLVPSTNPDRAKNGCCSRAVASHNPEWYKELCGMFLDYRGKTILKRKSILRILRLLKDGKDSVSKYQPYLRDIAERMAEDLNFSEFELRYFIEFGELPKPFEEQF
jgi:hypothetical protein